MLSKEALYHEVKKYFPAEKIHVYKDTVYISTDGMNTDVEFSISGQGDFLTVSFLGIHFRQSHVHPNYNLTKVVEDTVELLKKVMEDKSKRMLELISYLQEGEC